MISAQIDVASDPSQILFKKQADRCTAIAPLPDVAAAQRLVASAPTRLANMPKLPRPSGLMEDDIDSSDALRQ